MAMVLELRRHWLAGGRHRLAVPDDPNYCQPCPTHHATPWIWHTPVVHEAVTQVQVQVCFTSVDGQVQPLDAA
jgi:hypothetical protein